jgi:hypothetical protein
MLQHQTSRGRAERGVLSNSRPAETGLAGEARRDELAMVRKLPGWK